MEDLEVCHGRSREVIRGRGRFMGGHGRPWEAMGGHGRSWEVLGGHGRSWGIMGECRSNSWASRYKIVMEFAEQCEIFMKIFKFSDYFWHVFEAFSHKQKSWKDVRLYERYENSWEVMGVHGRPWEVVGGHRRSWEVQNSHRICRAV